MDQPAPRLTQLLLWITLAASLAAGCDDPFGLPDPEGARRDFEMLPPRDPRLPPGFDLALPEGAVVRYGESTATRATALLTTRAPAEQVLRFVRDHLESRGWTVRAREHSTRPPARWREAIDAFDAERPVASAVIERGAADVTRLHWSRRQHDGRIFHAPDEPRGWRVIERAPLPALPGRTEPLCMRALQRLCAEQARAGGPDAAACAMDHRAACGFSSEPGYLQRAVADADARLTAALIAHAMVGSRGARAQTLAQLRVELLGAHANLVRAGGARTADRGPPVQTSGLAMTIARTRGDGVQLDDDFSAWFLPPPAARGPSNTTP